MRKTVLSGLAMVAMLASMSAIAPTAMAADAHNYSTDSGKGAEARWQYNGDKLFICDLRSDGRRAVVFYHTSSDLEYYHFSYAGGTGGCASKTINLPEDGGWINFFACRQNGANGDWTDCNDDRSFAWASSKGNNVP